MVIKQQDIIEIDGFKMTDSFIDILKKFFPRDNNELELKKDMLMEILTAAVVIAQEEEDEEGYCKKHLCDIANYL